MSNIDVRRIARLSRLHLTDDEVTFLKTQVSQILGFVEKLQEVNVEGVEPTSHPLTMSNVFRKDEIIPSLITEKFLEKSPKVRGRFFEVPKVIEDK